MTDNTASLRFGHHSDRGPRETNEDTVLEIQLPDGRWLTAVADGLGGLAKGELASKVALGALYRHLASGGGLIEAVQEANNAVLAEGKGQDMGTTLVAALFSGSSAEIVNVGDSRAYIFDPLGLIQVSRDHTMGEEAARVGSLSRKEAAAAPWGGALARYLGAGQDVEVDIFGPLHLQEGNWILLCSDGLYRVVSGGQMEAALRGGNDPREVARHMVDEALERNTPDNVSVALAFRPGSSSEPWRARGSRAGDQKWDLARSLARPKRSGGRKRKNPRWVLRILLVLIPLLIAAALAWRWWVSRGTG